MRWMLLGIAVLFTLVIDGTVEGQIASTTANERTQRPNGNFAATFLDQFQPYLASQKLSGDVALSGAVQLKDLGVTWAENFKQFHPNVNFSGEALGSQEAVSALANDNRVIAGVCRPVDQNDFEMLTRGSCRDPLAIVVALDAVSIIVHANNPATNISMTQLQQLLRAQDSRSVATWQQLGLASQNNPINCYTDSESKGIDRFLNEVVQGRTGTMKLAKRLASTNEVCDAVANDPYGIGFASFSAEHPGVKRLAIVANGESIAATPEKVFAGNYPFICPMMLVVDRSMFAVDQNLRVSVFEYVLSKNGQRDVMKAGFFPIHPSFARRQLDEIAGNVVR